MEKNYLVFEASSTLTLSPSNGVLNITAPTAGSFIPVVYKRIVSTKKTTGAAGTANRRTVTITRAASTEYALNIVREIGSNTDGTSEVKSFVVNHTSSAGAASDESIADAFVLAINKFSTSHGVTAAKTGATTFTVDSTAANPTMSIGVIRGTLAVANTTPAVLPVNTGAQLIAAQITATAGINYTSYEVVAEVPTDNSPLGGSRFQKVVQVIYVNPAETTHLAKLDAVFNAPVANSNMIKRYTAAQIAALTAADHAGGVVYQTDGTVGYYYCNGTTWALLANYVDFDELIGTGI